MSKFLTLKQRFNACFILIIVLFLMLMSNELKRRNYLTADQSVNSVFKDRLAALDYTYKLDQLFYKKELDLASVKSNTDYEVGDNDIDRLLENFSSTPNMPKESVYFKSLKDDYKKLQSLENSFVTNQGSASREEMRILLKKIDQNLDQLSTMQISEGRELTQISDKALAMNMLILKLEVAFLVVIGLLVLLIIFKREKPVMTLVD